MDTVSVSYYIISLIVLITLSAIFSASETAIFSVNQLKLISLVDDKVKNAKKLQNLLEKPNEVLTTILIVNNMVNILTSSIATVLMCELFGSFGVGIATGLITVLVLVFGEITPKTFAIQNCEKIALFMAGLITLLVKVMNPVVWIFSKVTSFLLMFNKNRHVENNILTEEEIKTLVNVSEEKGVLNVSEKEMIHNVFDFDEKSVKEMMIPRINIVALDINSSYTEVVELIREEKYSRIPVYDKNIDNIIGILNIKDMLLFNIDIESFNLRTFIRESYTTYEFKKSSDLLKEMKKSKNHIAIVLDEYGGTKGIVTMEDLIEEIVGDIDDEYDSIEDKDIVKISSKEYIANGVARVDDIIDSTGLNILLESTNYDSIGGYIINHLNRFPNKGEKIELSNGIIYILKIDKNSIQKIKILLKS